MGLWKYLGAPISAIATAIQGNQAKQRRKGQIGEAYRVNKAQMDLDQSHVRQDTNEGFNERGILTAGAVQPSPIASAMQLAVASGGPKFGSLTPYLPAAGRNAVGPTNTLSGAANSAETDQFAREQKNLLDQKTQDTNLNRANYLNSIVGGVERGIDTAGNIAAATAGVPTAGTAQETALPDLGPPPSGTQMTPSADSPVKGAYDMSPIPDFSGGIKQSPNRTILGTGQSNASFNTSP